MPQEVFDSKKFINKLKGKSTIFDRTKKKSAPSGFVEDAEIIKRFGLKPGKGATAKVRLTSCSIVEVNENPVFKFRFSVVEGENQGTPLSSDVWLDLNDDERFQNALEELIFSFQKMGYETEGMDVSDLYDMALKLSEDKPYLMVYLSCWKRKSGKRKGELAYGIRINSAAAFAINESKESPEEEEVEEEELEEELDDEVDATEAEDSDFDEEDPKTWVGYVANVDIEGDTVEATLLSYSEEEDTFSVKLEDGTTVDVEADAIVEFPEE